MLKIIVISFLVSMCQTPNPRNTSLKHTHPYYKEEIEKLKKLVRDLEDRVETLEAESLLSGSEWD